jgi:DNA processing protein
MTDRLRALLSFTMTEGIGRVIYSRLVDHFGSIEEAASAPIEQVARIKGIGKKLSARIASIRSGEWPDRELDDARKQDVRIVAHFDPEFPAPLRDVPDAPLLLYIKGDYTDSDLAAVAIVGSRKCTHYGKSQATRFARDLTRLGITIVSGLARGIDTAAHWSAIKAGGRTLAVLGTGLSRIYPPENFELAGQVTRHGCLLSEFNLRTSPNATNFPRRNRIVSALSTGVVVMEAPKKSGALNTAQWAAEQGRDVFVLPANVDSAASEGSLRLLADGAGPAVSPDDVFKRLAPRLRATVPTPTNSPTPDLPDPLPVPLTDDEHRVYSVLSSAPLGIEAVIQETALAPGPVSAILLQLELKQLAIQLPGKQYIRAR